MKDIHEYIKEAVSEKDQSILNLLNAFAKMSSGVQQALFQEKSKNADSVEHIESMEEILSKEEMGHIKKYIRPKPKMCYENAFKVAEYLEETGHDAKYVEGFINMKGLPIEHAFVQVDGKFIDPTIELGLGNDPNNDSYVYYAIIDINDCRKILVDNGFWGQIFDTMFLNKYKENVKITA